MGSFSTSLSGVEAGSQALAVVSNNLANLNTTAYKNQEANFKDFFYQMLGTDGAGDPTQIGAGSVIDSVTSAFTQGTIGSTGVPTDMAIQGDGFFVEQNGGSTLYTRAGDFSQNASGYLMTSDGGYVLGYPAVNGVISPSQTLAPLQIANGQISAPNATTNIELTMNLNASGTTAAAATGTLTATGNASAGDMVTVGGTTYTFVTSFSANPTVPDQVLIATTAQGGEAQTLANLAAAINGQGAGSTCSTGTVANTEVTATANGSAGTVSLTAINAGTAGDNITTTVSLSNGSSFGASFGATTLTGGTDNAWTYQITLPAADEGGTGSPIVLNSGTLQFDGNGNLISPTANVTGISATNLADGASPISFTWQLLNPTTGVANVTQVAGQSNVSSAEQDGYTSGALQSFTINTDGTIQGIFSNGQTLTLGQVALATFQNTQGLQLNGSNTYLATPAAGIPAIGTPNSGGRGTIVGESLEASNVDMTTELSDLIVAERDYQSNARAISTADQMLNYVLTMQP